MDGVPPSAEPERAAEVAATTVSERLRKAKAPRTESEKIVEHPTARNPASSAVPENKKRLTREKRVLLSSEEEREIERLVDRIGEDLGTSLKLSHLLRACMALLCHAEVALHTTATSLGTLIRPANGDAITLAQFEFELAKLLSRALRDSLPLR